MGAVRPPVDSEKNGAHVASVVPFRCACLPSLRAEELLWEQGSSERKAQGGTCTSLLLLYSHCRGMVEAIVVRPLSYSRTPPPPPPRPPLTTFVSGVRPVTHLIRERRGDSIHHHFPSLSLSSFGCCGRCRLPRLHVEFAPFLPFIFICAHSGTDAPFCTLAPCPLLQCACHTCHNVTLAFCFAPPSFPSLF